MKNGDRYTSMLAKAFSDAFIGEVYLAEIKDNPSKREKFLIDYYEAKIDYIYATANTALDNPHNNAAGEIRLHQ